MANSELLNDDICFDVLLRLPTKDLVRLKCVCKRWCQLISDRIFWRIHSRREPISGFFFPLKFKVYSADVKTIAYIPVERQGSGLYQPDFNFLPEAVEVLASCNGLICCQSSFSPRDHALYVGNPLKKEWIRIKWTKPVIKGSTALAFDPLKDTADSSINFKLIRVQQFETGTEDPYFSFNMFSSDTGSWRISRKICRCRSNLDRNEAIFIEGILHWLTECGDIIAFDVQNQNSWVISVPFFPDLAGDSDILYEWCIGQSDGHLHYILASDYKFQIWTLEDSVKCKWNFKYSRSVEVIVEENPSLRRKSHYIWPMNPLAFKDGYLLLESSGIYLYNVETNKMHEVFSNSDLRKYDYSSSIAVTYSMSLVPVNSAQG